MANYEFITLRYSNSCDIGDVVFQNGFTYELNVIGVLGEPKYEHIERVNENEDKEISFNAKTLKKTITLLTVGNEQRLDVLNFIRLCDTKILVNKAGQIYNINEMQVEADLSSGIALIKVQFVLFTVTNTICCSNNSKNDNIDNPLILTNYFTIISDKYNQPSSIPIGSLCLLLLDGKYYVIIRVSTTNNSGLEAGWDYYPLSDNQYVYSDEVAFYGQRPFDAVNLAEVIALPHISSIVNTTGNFYRVSGQALQGFVVGFMKLDGSTYVNININSTSYNYTTSNNYNGSGVLIELTATTYIRAYLATITAPTTPLCYSLDTLIVI